MIDRCSWIMWSFTSNYFLIEIICFLNQPKTQAISSSKGGYRPLDLTRGDLNFTFFITCKKKKKNLHNIDVTVLCKTRHKQPIFSLQLISCPVFAWFPLIRVSCIVCAKLSTNQTFWWALLNNNNKKTLQLYSCVLPAEMPGFWLLNSVSLTTAHVLLSYL